MEKLMYIDGEWVGSELEKLRVKNPATGEIVGTVPKAGGKETRFAIEAADKAFHTWSQTTAYERSRYLEHLYERMIAKKEKLARMITLEMGKPINEAKGEVDYGASFLKWFAEEGKRLYGRTIPSHIENKRMLVVKQPVGVVGAITPWNFPVAMITRKLAPALAAGCTIVIKPAEETPLSALMLAELCEEVGLPKGVVNIVTGDPEPIGDELLTNPLVKKITFTGSTEVGKMLLEKGAKQVKKMSMELGGHAPIIVLNDADLNKAVQGAIASKFRNGGQTCICGNRIYVEEDIHDEFVERFKEAASQLKIGNGLDEDVQIGPIINRSGFEKIDRHVKDALELGALCVLGGKAEINNNAYFYYPTILTNVKPDMLIMNEETFGPVAPIQKVKNADEAVKLANRSSYGLAAYVYTENYAKGIRISEQLQFGIVGWNDPVPSAAQSPFGGFKQSGIGREGGIEGIEAYVETKYIAIGL